FLRSLPVSGSSRLINKGILHFPFLNFFFIKRLPSLFHCYYSKHLGEWKKGKRERFSITHKQIVFRYYRYYGKPNNAKRDLPYEIKMTSRLLLDALCFEWNKKTL